MPPQEQHTNRNLGMAKSAGILHLQGAIYVEASLKL